MYRNQKGIAPLILLLATFLVICSVGLGLALKSSLTDSMSTAGDGDRSLNADSLTKSIGNFFRGLTGSQIPDENESGSPVYTKLPLGDHLYTTAPKKGYIYTCNQNFSRNGGAYSAGSWIDLKNGSWDLTKKVMVDGSVSWHNARWSVSADGNTRKLIGNGLPLNHPTGMFPVNSYDDAYLYDKNPNQIKEQSYNLSLPVNPELLARPECVGGEVGIMLSGVPIFNGFDAGGRDAVAWEVQDGCNGHPQQSGLYHYHGPSKCMQDNTGEKDHSALVGYAFDGFGIYGIKGAGGVELSTTHLDECHGHSHVINWDGKNVEMYHYHMTNDFPYSVSCFRGKKAVSAPLGTAKTTAGASGGNEEVRQEQSTQYPQYPELTQESTEMTGTVNDSYTYNPQNNYLPDYSIPLSNPAILPPSQLHTPPAPTQPNPAPAPQPHTLQPTANTSVSTPNTQSADTGSNGTSGGGFSASSSTGSDQTPTRGESKQTATGQTTASSCSTTALSKNSVVSSSTVVTYTYTYPEASKITSINLPATQGVRFSMLGQESASGQGLNLNFGAGQTTVQFTVIVDQPCSPYSVSFQMTNSCGKTLGDWIAIGSASGYGAHCQ